MKDLSIRLNNLTVLYVEDEDVIRLNVESCLKFLFKNTIVASNGQEGLHKFLEEDIDLIITDLNMPMKNGISMIKDIKKISPYLPIIVTTACTSEVTDEVKDLGIETFVLKPFDIKELISKVYDLSA